MPEKKSGGSGLKKKMGPLPVWGWVAAGGVGFLAYRFIRARRSAGQVVAASGTTGGGATGTIPLGVLPATGAATGAGTFSSVPAWEQAMLTFLTGNGMSPGDAFSAVTSWLNGNCVSSAAYKAISEAIVSTSVGLPPGFSTMPTLSVCANTPSNPPPSGGGTPPPPPAPPSNPQPVFPGLPSSIANPMVANGESIAATAWDAANNEWIVLTNKGGIYNIAANGQPGGVFYGSYLGLPASDRATAPGQNRVFNQLFINPDGTYTIVDTAGESYTFNKATAALEGITVT